MAERDRFELDLAAALRAYAEDAPTQVRPTELARKFAAAYPHGRTTIAPWRLAAVPRLAWILVALAALLTALVAGMLVAGSQPERKLPAVVPPVGQLFACPPGSTPDRPGPVDQARPTQSVEDKIVFDSRAGRLVVVGDAGDGVETWTFDVCTNTWTQMHPDREPPSTVWGQLVYDVDSDATIGVASGKVWAYDLETDTWTEKGVAPSDGCPGNEFTPCSAFGAYDPVSGLVVAASNLVDPMELLSYDVETDTWTQIHQANGPPWGWGLFAYDASVDRLVEYTGGDLGHEMWLLDIRTGTWSKSGAEAPSFWMGLWGVMPAVVYDEAAERTVFSGVGRTAAYDATADRWEILVEAAPGGLSLYKPMAYDPLNRRFVGWGREGTDGAVVAFALATREWTVLLEPSEGQPAP